MDPRLERDEGALPTPNKNPTPPRGTAGSGNDVAIASDTPLEIPVQASKNWWLVLAKLIFGSGLLIALMWRADFGAIVDRLRSVNLNFLLLVFLLPHLMIMVSTWKWQIFLRELRVDLPFGRLFRVYLIGTFFNNFLPTMVGGDVVRVYTLGREAKAMSAVAAATVMERLIGFTALISLLPLALFSRTVTERFPAIWYLIPVAAIGFAVTVWIALSSSWLRLGEPLRNIRYVGRIVRIHSRIHDSVRLAARSVSALSITFALSILFYLVAAATIWVAALSLGAEVSFAYLLATVPLLLLVSMLPISLNGLGITEGGIAVLLVLAGVSLTDAVGVGLLLRGRLLFTALLGGFVFLRYRPSQGRE